LTHSRGALIGILALLAIVARGRIGTFRTSLLIVALLAAVQVSQFGGGRDFSSKEESAGQRVEAWSAGLAMLRSKPVLGVGYGNFTDHHYLTAHNSFVLCFAELGMIGYFIWLGMIVLAFKSLGRGLAQAPPDVIDANRLVHLRAALIGFLVCSGLLSRTYQPGLFLLLALCAAGWWNAARSSPQTAAEAETTIPWVRTTFFWAIGSVLGLYILTTVDRAMGGG